jgi:SWI/SNF-related matrix-associated actin-dependent regulator 1 of chromatin subfamily A
MAQATEELFPFQLFGAEWLSRRKTGLLADEMGMGKSAQVIRACDRIGAQRICVLAPANARINWEREFRKFSPVSRRLDVVLTGDDFAKRRSGAGLICSYDLASKVDWSRPENKFDVLILDEAHYLKAPSAIRTRTALGKVGAVRSAERVWAVTGTPMPNHPGEIWTLLYTFGATKLSYDSFVERYCTFYTVGQFQKRITGANKERIPELRELLRKIMLRRIKEPGMLPEISFDDVVLEPGEISNYWIEQYLTRWIMPEDNTKGLYQEIDREQTLVASLLGQVGFNKHTPSGAGMQALEALAKSVSTLRQFTGLQKVKGTVELVTQELESGAYEKIVIFAIHRGVIEELRQQLKKFKPVTLYGGTDPKTRQKNIDKFQKNPRCKVFIGNIHAAGVAITLTAAHNVLFVEQDWVPGNNAQAAMRCHRIGQTKPVYVRFAGLANSIDEKIAQVLKRKTRDLSAILDLQNEMKPVSVSENEVKENEV